MEDASTAEAKDADSQDQKIPRKESSESSVSVRDTKRDQSKSPPKFNSGPLNTLGGNENQFISRSKPGFNEPLSLVPSTPEEEKEEVPPMIQSSLVKRYLASSDATLKFWDNLEKNYPCKRCSRYHRYISIKGGGLGEMRDPAAGGHSEMDKILRDEFPEERHERLMDTASTVLVDLPINSNFKSAGTHNKKAQPKATPSYLAAKSDPKKVKKKVSYASSETKTS